MPRPLLFLALLIGACTSVLSPTAPQHLFDTTVALVDEGRPYCAATWVSQERLLTAAHCVFDEETGEVLGSVQFAFREDVPRELGAKPKIVYTGKVVAVDEDSDLALVVARVPPHSVAKVASVDPELGDRLRIIGHPVGLTWTYVEGLSNGLREMPTVGTMLQVVAPVFYGNSGGGAFNDVGELVGVSSFIVRAPNESFFVPRSAIVRFLSRAGNTS